MAVPSSSGTVLKITDLARVDGRGELVRKTKNLKGEEIIVDFWNDVVRFDSSKLEVLLTIAKSSADYDMTLFIRAIEYQGFDREFFIKFALSKMPVSVFCRFAILGAIRGSNFSRITETCESMPQDLITGFSSYGFIKTPKKKTDLTILRCTASIPHWCAFYMLTAGVEKKIKTQNCHAALQFPGAASLPMSRQVRLDHASFCAAFSSILPGGQFKSSIYLTAMGNPIPINDIPTELLAILEVKSASESYLLTEDDVKGYSTQITKSK
jgi:hypothetical protein